MSTPHLLRTVDEVRAFVRQKKASGQRIAFVPTMGALHAGHMSLVHRAKGLADCVIVSIYVNPTQFGPNEDFTRYPRTLDRDAELCAKEGVAAIFCPSDDVMYPNQRFISFQLDTLNLELCGPKRPGHFEGVVLVVNKLFNIVQPDVAVFGQKDIQQLTIIKTMVKELNMDVEVVMGDTIRDPDGLAMSSRNRYLSPEERSKSTAVYQALRMVHDPLQVGVNVEDLTIAGERHLIQNGFKVDYLSVVEAQTLTKAVNITPGNTYIIAAAAYLGSTRLIDNLIKTLS